MYDAVNYCIGMYPTAKAVMPVFYAVLGTKDGATFSISAFNQLKQKMFLLLSKIINKPLVQYQQGVSLIFSCHALRNT